MCETSDIFAKELYLPQLKQGDLLAIRSSGAYGAVCLMNITQDL